jgi:DNA-binding HxlR family transcriptional regulator
VRWGSLLFRYRSRLIHWVSNLALRRWEVRNSHAINFEFELPFVNYTSFPTIHNLWIVTLSLPNTGILVRDRIVRKSSSNASVLDAQCPSRLVLDRIADKWTALIIQILAKGTMRYAALQREIGDISQKMLTQTLRSLERDGLVQRKVHPVVPPKVEYSLTRLGRTLIEPLHALCRWSEKHLHELEANRARANAGATVAERGSLQYR